MAIYHCSVKPVQRSKGRSAVAAAAYRAREKLADERQGLTFEYTSKQDLQHSEIIGWSGSRGDLWNAAELAERRKDATTAREYEVAIPRELSTVDRVALVHDYGQWLHERHGVAVDIAIHTDTGDSNPHAHIMTTTRAAEHGQLADEKVPREWSDAKRKQHGMVGRKADLEEARVSWADLANRSLERAGIDEQIDHRSWEDQGIDSAPQIKMGPAATALERQGISTALGDANRERSAENAQLVEQLDDRPIGEQWQDAVASAADVIRDQRAELLEQAEAGYQQAQDREQLHQANPPEWKLTGIFGGNKARLQAWQAEGREFTKDVHRADGGLQVIRGAMEERQIEAAAVAQVREDLPELGVGHDREMEERREARIAELRAEREQRRERDRERGDDDDLDLGR